MKIRVVAVGSGLLGVIKVSDNGEFDVEKITDETYEGLLKRRLAEILSQDCLPVWVPVKEQNVSGVIYCRKGDQLYPYGVANEFSSARIGTLAVRAEVIKVSPPY